MLSNLLIVLANIIDAVLTIYYWLIIVNALLSWVNPDPYNPAVRFLNRVTEPVLAPVRRVLPLGTGYGIDLSPLIAIFAIYAIKALIVGALLKLAARLALS